MTLAEQVAWQRSMDRNREVVDYRTLLARTSAAISALGALQKGDREAAEGLRGALIDTAAVALELAERVAQPVPPT